MDDPRPDSGSAFRLLGHLDGVELALDLAEGANSVGSRAPARHVLPFAGVSRRHAVLVVEGGRVTVIDQGSKNGTLLNGSKVRRAELSPGDRLAFGPLELRFRRLDDAADRIAIEITPAAPADRLQGPLETTTVEASSAFLQPPDRPSSKPADACLIFPEGHVPGTAPEMREIYAQIQAVARWDVSVLLAGETGAGKEPLAAAIHLSSSRADMPLVAINCAAIPAELLEAEMFGIGARVATGVGARRGRFQEAHGGTLFLDEIGEMPLELQPKLLRVLQERLVRPLGEPPVPVDVRIVAATNVDVPALVDSGRLRRDLYFRLAGLLVRVPPLRRRAEDIPLLVKGMVSRFAAEMGKPVRGVTEGALRALLDAPWPGNVRELENVLRRAVIFCPSGGAIDRPLLDRIQPPPAPPGIGSEEPAPASSLNLETLERKAIREALARANGNQVQAAKLLGISRHSLRRRLQHLGG
ncbi:MAG TPA: sigma 54-interacting transcriptional regulator [Thermoanaerobaculia bacterium]|nr:sigma 54-interacting transcriptional regulator [Thermoanaerobaculia bacterium]